MHKCLRFDYLLDFEPFFEHEIKVEQCFGLVKKRRISVIVSTFVKFGKTEHLCCLCHLPSV